MKIRKCPFCGSEMEKFPYGTLIQHPYVGCVLDGFVLHKDKFNLWNARIPMKNILDELLKFKEIIQKKYEEYFFTNQFEKCNRENGKQDALNEFIEIIKKYM